MAVTMMARPPATDSNRAPTGKPDAVLEADMLKQAILDPLEDSDYKHRMAAIRIGAPRAQPKPTASRSPLTWFDEVSF